MKNYLIKLFVAVAIVSGFGVANAADWKPSGPIKLMIAFAAGGGADTQARLIAQDLEASTGWKFIVENVTGRGGVNLLAGMRGMPNDGTVIGMAVTETLAYNRVAAAFQGYELELADFTALTTTAGFEMGVVAKADTGFASFDDVTAAAKAGRELRFGVMSPRQADLANLLGKANDIEFKLVPLTGGKGFMDALDAGDVDISWGAGVQTKAVLAGDMVNLVSGISKPLKASPDAPLLSDLGVDYNAEAFFMFVAPAGIDDAARTALTEALAGVASNPDSKAGALIQETFGGATVIKGAELDAMLAADSIAATELIKASSE